jgi:hypothetical protein
VRKVTPLPTLINQAQILENGRSTKDNPAHVQPGRFIENITTPGSGIFTHYLSIPGINLDGRAPMASNANCMGGGSSINGD